MNKHYNSKSLTHCVALNAVYLLNFKCYINIPVGIVNDLTG